mmetsp:Transcript_126790/g.344197  ORF Transcript_126790/g.344197 Transcript_126790/m.344197 type:complete len:393 (+) Transcript_126790:93-1271(+)
MGSAGLRHSRRPRVPPPRWQQAVRAAAVAILLRELLQDQLQQQEVGAGDVPTHAPVQEVEHGPCGAPVARRRAAGAPVFLQHAARPLGVEQAPGLLQAAVARPHAEDLHEHLNDESELPDELVQGNELFEGDFSVHVPVDVSEQVSDALILVRPGEPLALDPLHADLELAHGDERVALPDDRQERVLECRIVPAEEVHEGEQILGAVVQVGAPLHPILVRVHLPIAVCVRHATPELDLAVLGRRAVPHGEDAARGDPVHGAPGARDASLERVDLAVGEHESDVLQVARALLVGQVEQEVGGEPVVPPVEVELELGLLGLHEGEARQAAQAVPDLEHVLRVVKVHPADLLVLRVHQPEEEHHHHVGAVLLLPADGQQLPHLRGLQVQLVRDGP